MAARQRSGPKSEQRRKPGQTPIGPPPPAAVAWRWMSVLHARVIEHLEQDAAAAGAVPFTWFEVLSALEMAPANRVRLKDLTGTVLLTRAGVSRLIDRIEAEGLLKREAFAKDARGAEAVLTPAGTAALIRARPVYAATIEQRFGRHVTAAELAGFTRLFRHILAANDWLEDARPVPLTVGKRQPGPPGHR